ncbi:hypothetical protein LINPERHAP2_LOCUS15948 [Linum perenne]
MLCRQRLSRVQPVRLLIDLSKISCGGQLRRRRRFISLPGTIYVNPKRRGTWPQIGSAPK